MASSLSLARFFELMNSSRFLSLLLIAASVIPRGISPTYPLLGEFLLFIIASLTWSSLGLGSALTPCKAGCMLTFLVGFKLSRISLRRSLSIGALSNLIWSTGWPPPQSSSCWGYSWTLASCLSALKVIRCSWV
jgi:hypothetical protein